MSFHELHPSLPEWLSATETRLAALFEGEFSGLHEAGTTVVGSRGKRLRPVLLMLACDCYGQVTPRAVNNGCLIELIHVASLVHDDVVDEADIRRGELSARARWGNKFSLLLGDFLLARAFEFATDDGDLAVLRWLAPTATEMGRGVILELSHLNIDAGEETYWQVVHGKTAVLFAASAAIGALIGGASPEQQRAMYRMGECFGYAFQLSDDLLDLQGTEEITGKPLQSDWRQRRATLPLLYALTHSPPATIKQIRMLWLHEPFTVEQFDNLRCLVEAAGGFEFGREKVKEYLAEACVYLHSLPASAGRDALLRLCTERFPLPVMPSAM